MILTLKKRGNADWLRFSIYVALIYQMIWPYVLPPIPFFPLIPYVLIDFFLLLYIFGYSGKKLSTEFVFIVFFVVYCLITGLLLSTNRSYFMNNISWAIEFFALAISAFFLCKYENKIDDFISFIWLLSFVYLLISNLKGVQIAGRLALSNDSNPNTLGIMCCFLVATTTYIYFKKKRGIISLIISFGIYIFAFLTCLNSGSKKGIIAIVIFLVIYFLPYLIRILKRNIIKFVIITVSLLSLYLVFRVQIQTIWEGSITYQRVLGSSGIDIERSLLFQDAIRVFVNHPILGVGYQNYGLFSSTNMYSHSTYAETLACTGIIGTFLWFLPYIIILYKLIKAHLFDNSEFRFCMALFVVQLFFDTVMVTYYNPLHYLIYAMIIARINSIVLENRGEKIKEKEGVLA